MSPPRTKGQRLTPGEYKRGFAPLYFFIPPSLIGEGDTGGKVDKNTPLTPFYTNAIIMAWEQSGTSDVMWYAQ